MLDRRTYLSSRVRYVVFGVMLAMTNLNVIDVMSRERHGIIRWKYEPEPVRGKKNVRLHARLNRAIGRMTCHT